MDKFISSPSPFFDFLLCLNEEHSLSNELNSIGFTKIKLQKGHLYINITPPNATTGYELLSGIMQTNGRLIAGPQILQKSSSAKSKNIGQYILINTSDQSPIIQTDFLGLIPVFYNENCASNRLELIKIYLKKSGRLQFDPSAALTHFTSDNSFGMQIGIFDTPISGVRILPALSKLSINKEKIVETKLTEPHTFETGSQNTYEKLITQAAAEITENIQAATHLTNIIELPITAGRDSRVILAAILATDNIKNVTFSTHDRDNDTLIASGLVHRYGGRYGTERKLLGWASHTMDDRLNSRRQFYSGLYHLMRWGLFPEHSPIYSDQAIQLVGGLGEIYRSFYQKEPRFAKHLTNSSSLAICEILDNSQWSGSIKNYKAQITEKYIDTFNQLPGETFDQKLTFHYINFRSRMHFGLTSLSRGISTVIWNPLASPSLLQASLCLPATLRNSGRAIFDVTKELYEEIAYYEYGKPAPNFWDLSFHKKSTFDGQFIKVLPRKEIIKGIRRIGPAPPPSTNPNTDNYVRENLLGLYEKSVEILPEISTPEFKKRTEWIIQKGGIRAADALYSKLDSINKCWT